jgi:hypothetical protein
LKKLIGGLSRGCLSRYCRLNVSDGGLQAGNRRLPRRCFSVNRRLRAVISLLIAVCN